MKVLVVGSGGREHAIVDAIVRDKDVQVYCAPGNAGIAEQAEIVELKPNDVAGLFKFARDNKIDLTVVGSEQPLATGMVDAFQDRKKVIFGPRRLAARLETSKVFAKEFMKRWKIPTAMSKTFSSRDGEPLSTYLSKSKYPLVLKADGLAAGKGVSIVDSLKQAKEEVEKFFVKKIFGEAGERIVVEEFMFGVEASVFAVTDGTDYVVLPPAQDHKRIGDGDTGKNTGGMGSIAPTPFLDETTMRKVREDIIEKVIRGTSEEGFPYSGCLYCGLMLTKDGPKVVEFNARFGDPETQTVLQLIDSSFLDLLYFASTKRMRSYRLKTNGAASVCVIAASKGYPDEYEKGKSISGLEKHHAGIRVFHSGTTLAGGKYATNGGRVLGVTATDKGGKVSVAAQLAYARVREIHFDGMYFRHDIGRNAIEFEKREKINK
ncbi:MAG TPA: phosphoribosylamine--glycine ligase [Candidatus Acidoferrales bacterium]|nr:phosphoribosylamine--glycine ligase [Candidatus Acidoferrales bacterium]